MSYCLNPDCQKPHNPGDAKFCLRCGTRLLLGDRYRALKLIGESLFGRTFLSLDEGNPTKPSCVIKQFFPQAQSTDKPEEAAQLFEQKAMRLEEIGKHPQLPELLAHFNQNQYQYFVQEFIDGPNLAQELEANGAFNENQIRQLLKEILPVLQFVHERNVIHRDIKPKNLIRHSVSTSDSHDESISAEQGEEGKTQDVQLVLVDFGAAKFATEAVLPSTGTVIGTSGFVAPEQALGQGTFASDLYSLGVTCIHLLTQLDPFKLYSVSEATWVWRDRVSHPVSVGLGSILEKMLEHATRRRYQNAADVLADLNRLDMATEGPALSDEASETPTVSNLATESPAISVTPTAPYPQPAPQVPTIAETAPTSLGQKNWQCVKTFVGHAGSDWYAGITSVAFSPDGALLVAGTEQGIIKIWELSTGNEIRTLTGLSDFVHSIAISPDGKLITSASNDVIQLYELSTGQEVRTLSGHSAIIQGVAFSPDGQILASGGNDQTIRLWNPNTGETIRTLSRTNLIDAVKFSPNGQILASSDRSNKITLWNPNTGEEIRTLSGHSRKIFAVSFSPDGQILASGSGDKTIKIWQIETGTLLHTLTGHSGWFAAVNSVAFSPDGQLLASSSDDKTIKLWNPVTGAVITTLSGHTKGVSSVTFSPDGQTLASGSLDKTIKMWRCN